MKSALAGFLAGLLFFGSIAHVEAAGPSAPLDAVLDNGMHVIVVPNRLAPVVTTSLTYGVGGNDDTIPGLAHATEHMLFRGTQETTSDQFANIATRIGAQYDAETTNLTTRFYFTLPSTYLDVVLRLEADRMAHATMSEADWKNERGAIEQEVKAHLSNPLLPVLSKATELFFGDSPWGQDPVGTVAAFDKMTAADIAAYYHAWYHPNNATLVIAGDVDPDAALASVKAFFGSIPPAKLPAHAPLVLQPLKATAIEQKVDFPVPVAISAFRLPGFDSPDYAASQVLFGALNSGRGPLSDLVLQGKALYAAGFDSAYPTVGTGNLVAIAKPGSDPKLMLADIDALIATYAQSGVPQALIDASKTRLIADQAYEGASIPGEAEDWSFSSVVRKQTPAQLYAAYASVTSDDVNRVFRTYIAGGERVTLALAANPSASISRAAASTAEDVAVTPRDGATLPSWTAKYFSAPLRAPKLQEKPAIFHLKNGMTIAVRREVSAPVVVVRGDILTNTDLNEPRGKDGVAGITAGLMSLGTTTHDYKAYQGELDSIAASIGLGTSFSATVGASDFDKAVSLLAEGELHPAFAPDQFTLVSNNTTQSMKAAEALPQTKANLARLYALYPPNDPHRRHATSTTTAAVTLADVRHWYGFAYRPDLTTVSVVGDVDPQTVRASFEKYFGAWKVTGPLPNLTYAPVRAPKRSAKTTTVTSSTTKQADVTLEQSLRQRRGDRDAVALSLANTLLSGEGTGSMLFHDVRKTKGFVYSIDSDLDMERSGSTFEVHYSSDTKNVEAAARAALATLERLRKYPPSATDLVLAKAMLLSRYVVPLASYGGVASELLDATEDDYGNADLSRYYADVLATTPADVQRAVARWIDPKKFTRVVILPSVP